MDDSNDVLLPPSAFHVTQTNSSGEKPTSFDLFRQEENRFIEDTRKRPDQPVDPPPPSQVATLLSQLTSAETQLHALEEQLRTSREENAQLQRARDEARLQMQHLRTYYMNTVDNKADQKKPIKVTELNGPSSASIDELANKIDELKRENAQIKTELELSMRRSNSLEAALKLQDKKRVLLASDDVKEQESMEKVVHHWRSHVLRLLVQLDQIKVEQEHATRRFSRERLELEKRHNDSQLELEAMRHRLQASEAAVVGAKGRIELLESELQRKSAQLETLKSEKDSQKQSILSSLRSVEKAIVKLAERVSSFAQPSTDSQGDAAISVLELMRRLRQLERRLCFAQNRLPIIRAKFALKAGPQFDQRDASTQTDNLLICGARSVIDVLEMEELLAHTQAELRQCVTERDCALRRLEQNARTFSEKVRDAEDAVRTEVVSLRELTVMLENDLRSKQEELNQCQIQLDSLKSDHLKLQEESSNELGQLRTQLMDAQKQLSKAMFELKQAKRRLDREVDERNVRTSEVEKTYESRIKTLEQALRLFQPDSYKWYGAPMESTVTTESDDKGSCPVERNPVTPAQLEALTCSINELTRLADCLKSSNESSDAEDNHPLDADLPAAKEKCL